MKQANKKINDFNTAVHPLFKGAVCIWLSYLAAPAIMEGPHMGVRIWCSVFALTFFVMGMQQIFWGPSQDFYAIDNQQTI